MKNDVPWKSAPTADSHGTWKSLANPLGFTTFFTGRRGPSPSTQNGRERERRSRKTISMTFGSCSAPHPSLNLTGHEPTFVNRTARGYGSVSSAASSNRVGNLRGLRSAAGRASIRVWCRLVLPSRNGNSRRGRATDGAVSCSLICVLSVSSALGRFLFLDWGSPHTG